MRICLLGDFSGTPDEGMKNISKTIRDALSARHSVLASNSRDMFRKDCFLRLRRFAPEIVHYLHGPTIRSLMILKGVKLLLEGETKIVLSATRPYFSKHSRWAIPFLRPDLVLTQSKRFEAFFQEKRCKVSFMPNGVDCNKFNIVSKSEKRILRQKLSLPKDRRIVLHVGHIKLNRGLDIFKKMQQIESIQVVIVGGTTEKSDDNIKQDLQRSGVLIFHEYFDDISIIYKASDLYVFPIRDTGNKLPDTYNQVGAIDLPLSVLEAMACNLPIVTTPFGALPRLFNQGGGLHYVEDDEDIIASVKDFSYEKVCRTRKKVLPYDWEQIVGRIEAEYFQLLQ